MDKSGMETKELNLLTDSAVPEDCSLLIINNPQKDISEDEKTTLTDYLKTADTCCCWQAPPRTRSPTDLPVFHRTEWIKERFCGRSGAPAFLQQQSL